MLEMGMLLSFRVSGHDYMQVKQQAQINNNPKVKKVKQNCAINIELGVFGFSRTWVEVGRATVRTDARLGVGCPTSVAGIG